MLAVVIKSVIPNTSDEVEAELRLELAIHECVRIITSQGTHSYLV